MLKENLLLALNRQFNREQYSAQLYLSMSSFCDEKGYRGISRWFKVQYHEEIMHSMKIYDYIHSRSGEIVYFDIEAPEESYSSMLDIFEKTLQHEIEVTGMINELMDQAIKESDHASQIFLQWFITEQVEEEGNVNDIISQIKLIQNNPQALMLLDRELGLRVMNTQTDFSNGVIKA